MLWVGVRCDAAVAEARELKRGDRVIGQAHDQAERVHQGVRYDVVVDTDAVAPGESARSLVMWIGGRTWAFACHVDDVNPAPTPRVGLPSGPAIRFDCPSARSLYDMFGRHKKNADAGGGRISVDATLESDIALVEQSVARYLGDPTDGPVSCSSRRLRASMRGRNRVTPTESR